MKKLGLRAVAGGLAVLMAVAGFAPATASAADTLITAAAPKTLVITADMVDDDGEIVISGEKWDRIVIEKEAAAKDIYFDGVEVGELVVESGSESNIQLWEVAAEKVTVKEPELVELDITEIRNLYSDKETKEQAFDLYMKAREENKKTLTKAPSIVTMDAAVVDSLSASGSVKLDVKKGEVKEFTLEASSKVSQMNVTLDGYTGDVTYKGTDKFSVVNFNSVNCEIENLKVEGSASNNYLNVESKNSVSANVEVAGNAALSLNIPITKLEVTEKATAAQVGVLNKVEELNVAANNATVKVGAEAKVVAANVVGNKVSIGGEGKLDNVEITGSDASVSTSGTGVKGENTYRPPAVKEPEKPAVQFGTLPEGSLVILPSETNMTGYGYSKEDLENGAVAVSFNGQYQEIQFNLPENVDLSKYDKMVVTLESPNASDANAVVFKVIATDATLDQYNNPTPFKEAWGVVKYPGGDVEVDLSGFASKKVCRFTLMANNGACNANVYRIAFIPAEGAPVVRPLVYENKVFTFADLTENWKNAEYTVDENGVATISFTGQYQSVLMDLPEALNASDYPLMKVKISSTAGVAGKVWMVGEDADNPTATNYGFVDAGGEMNLEKISGKDFQKIGFMSMSADGAYTATIESITFIGSGNIGKDEPDTPVVPDEPDTPVVPEGGTECVANKWEVKLFNDVDLRDYAGTEVTFSFDMIKTGTKGDVLVHVQLNNAGYKADGSGAYEPVKWEDYLTDDWKSYTYTYKVPAEFANKEVQKNPIYLGLRTDDKVDYSPYKFYIKNYKFEGTPATPDTPVEPDEPDTPDVPGVSVKIEVPEKTTLTVGDTLQLKAVSSVTGSAITWISSDKAIATVDNNGVVTAVSGAAVTGSAVTIKAVCGDAFDTIDLTVVAKVEEPEVPENKGAVVDLSTKVKVSGEEPTVSGNSLVFSASNNKCAFTLPNAVKSGDKVDFEVDFDFTTLDTNSIVRFYLIKDGVDSALSTVPVIRTSEVDSTSVKKTLTLEASGDANQILFVNFAWDGSQPQVVTLNGITILE